MTQRSVLQVRTRLMRDGEIAMGPGKADLLLAIEETGSISAAAKHMGMSYRRAWLLVDTMNRCFQSPLVTSSAGGSHGGGAVVTDKGKEVLQHYQQLQGALEAVADGYRDALDKLIRQ